VQIRDRSCKLFDVDGGQGIVDGCCKSKYGIITEGVCLINDVGLKK
jgi:hypothetical protein